MSKIDSCADRCRGVDNRFDFGNSLRGIQKKHNGTSRIPAPDLKQIGCRHREPLLASAQCLLLGLARVPQHQALYCVLLHLSYSMLYASMVQER